MRILVSTQKLPKYSTSTRGKLTLPRHVLGKTGMLFPPELQKEGKAELIMFLEGTNEGSPPFVVTASLQKLRVVLLESGWKPIVGELQLKNGDTVSIFLLNNTPWTYLIAVEKAERNRIEEVDAMDEYVVPEEAPTRMEFDLNEPVQLDMKNNQNQPNQPVKMEFDLNELPQPHTEINLKKPNQPVKMQFDLNELPHPDVEINLNDER